MLFSDQLHSLSSRFEDNKMPFMPLLIRRITVTHKVVGGMIADLKDRIRYSIREQDKIRGII